MLLFLKSSSRTVHHYPDQESRIEVNKVRHSDDIDDNDIAGCCTSLTVWRKSLLFGCNGFTVIGSDGSLVYRVDNYSDNPNQMILMDGSGNPVFTICRRKQKLRLIDDNWLVYNGEVGKYCDTSARKPIFCVKKNVHILKTKQSAIAYVYNDGNSSAKGCAYMIEGSYKHRSCRILDESRQVVGEIKRKEASTGGVSFGLEVFVLVVNAAFDPGFAMAIVLLLDQMFQ
ncbi:protein LURP-one-related 8-like isoform X1 [Primulina tabacum]|uniref:protein LURP-one-related 8-like isoform X1 n=1 Tax=Primulina tabacum TaxID=48773 RepID=UPI003F5AC786